MTQHAFFEGRIVPIEEAKIISRVIAEHNVTGSQQILNKNYTVTIEPFPCEKGQSLEINKQVPLQFPEASQSGN